jgi:D-glucosaminate-6-phosphate ammonia-lyase
MSPFSRWNVAPVINATGTVTRLGGSALSERVLTAMNAAALESVSIEALQAAASRRIAEITGTEAAFVTSGASAALTLGAAAILAKRDTRRMLELPRGKGFAREFLVARDQRNGYDHAVRLAGAKLVDVGFDELSSGAGVRGVEAADFADAIVEGRTAGVLYVQRDGGRPKLDKVVNVAHTRLIKVLVDAAAELPPRANLSALPATGADLVCFSGGKAIRGPQGTGILCGDGELIASAALQMLDMDDHPELWNPPKDWIPFAEHFGMPRHGLGRGFKVGKEQIVGLLTALDEFLERDLVAEANERRAWLESLAAKLTSSRFRTELLESAHAEVAPTLALHVDRNSPQTALELCRRLREGEPSIYVGHALLHHGTLLVNPSCLREENLGPLAVALNAP